ncbi:hypothetical protein HKX48_001570 [Thoreauomyces humboldtii]|nr:hypothetical protein HKX48_001570 [Thoreauomyces humboldtii]
MNKRYKTKFPVARIKKIMRTDDEVGKVAQVTPVLISKALELFMQSLVEATCKETRLRGAKKMTNAHLYVKQRRTYDNIPGIIPSDEMAYRNLVSTRRRKRTILTEEKFDFLAGCVEALPDPAGEKGSEDDGSGTPTTATKGKGRAKRDSSAGTTGREGSAGSGRGRKPKIESYVEEPRKAEGSEDDL